MEMKPLSKGELPDWAYAAMGTASTAIPRTLLNPLLCTPVDDVYIHSIKGEVLGRRILTFMDSIRSHPPLWHPRDAAAFLGLYEKTVVKMADAQCGWRWASPEVRPAVLCCSLVTLITSPEVLVEIPLDDGHQLVCCLKL